MKKLKVVVPNIGRIIMTCPKILRTCLMKIHEVAPFWPNKARDESGDNNVWMVVRCFSLRAYFLNFDVSQKDFNFSSLFSFTDSRQPFFLSVMMVLEAVGGGGK